MKQKEGLNKKATTQICERLAHFMADSFVVYMKTLNFHWNMIGENFYMYHKLLEDQYNEAIIGIDAVAERIRQLGLQAPANMAEILSLSCIKESKAKLSQLQMVKELANDNSLLVEHCREIINYSDEEDDQGTSDLLIDRMRAHDKNAWMLRSHFEKKK